jgi:hypothetical protein
VLDIDLVAILDLPNELQGRELQIILSYIRELYLASTTLQDLNEDTSTLLMKRAKIILIGPGEAGKTTLLHRLVHGKFEGGYGMTDGINMTELVIDDLKLTFWDFSGQNIYMNTHLLFFSSEVVYLVIWNPRQHDHHSFITNYLNMIRNYAPTAPVILITTHAKDTSRVTDYTLKMIQNQSSHGTGSSLGSRPLSGLSSGPSSGPSGPPSGGSSSTPSQPSNGPTYGPICCYHHVDSQTGIGIQELKKDLVKYSLQQPWVVQRVPKIFKKLEMGLKELNQHGRFSLTRNEYLKYCWEVFKIDEENSLHALQLFHTWGVIHLLSSSPSPPPSSFSGTSFGRQFPDLSSSQQTLKATDSSPFSSSSSVTSFCSSAEMSIILEPQKLALVLSSAISYKAEAIYRMGDGKFGLLRHDEIDLIWKDFDETLRSQFLQIFHDHKLAYPLYDSKGQSLRASIVPAMLPDEPLGGGHGGEFFTTEDDLKLLYFPKTPPGPGLAGSCHASVRIECDYLPIAFIPKLQVRLSSLATLGGAWKYGCSLQLSSYHRLAEYTLTQSYAIIQSNPFLHTIDIYSGGDTTCARSLVIKCLLELQKESFSTLQFHDIKVYYQSEPIAAKKLIARKLKRDNLYSYLIYEGDDQETVAIPLRGLALLFPECYPRRLTLHHPIGGPPSCPDLGTGSDTGNGAGTGRGPGTGYGTGIGLVDFTEEDQRNEEFLTMKKIKLIHDEMINMSKALQIENNNSTSTPSPTTLTTTGVSSSPRILSSQTAAAAVGVGGEESITTPLATSTESQQPQSQIPPQIPSQYTIPIIDLLIKKKKLQRQQSNATENAKKNQKRPPPPAPSSSSSSPTTRHSNNNTVLKKLRSRPSSGAGAGTAGARTRPPSAIGGSGEEYIDYRSIIPTKLLTLEQVAYQVLLNPNTLEELIDLEAFFLECYPEILLYGCNIPMDLFEIHTLWVAFDDGRYIIPITPSEKPTNSWQPVPSCLLPVTPRSVRSTLPGINKRVSEIVLLVLKALGIECPPVPHVATTTAANTNMAMTTAAATGKKNRSGYLNPLFMMSSIWSGLVDLSSSPSFVDSIREMELKSFQSMENCLGKVIWVEKTVAGRMHAPNMSVSDQVFRELFKGTRGANPHAALLRDAIDDIIPISLGILPRYDLFISHSSVTNDQNTARLLAHYLQSRGYSVWIDSKTASGHGHSGSNDNGDTGLGGGLNKGMLSAIDSSSYILLLLSTDYVQQINTMAAQQNDLMSESTMEFTSYFQFIYSLKRKNVQRILPVMLEEELMRGWEIDITHEMIVNRYKVYQERERARAEEEEEEEEDGGGGGGEEKREKLEGEGLPRQEDGEEEGEEEEEILQIDQKDYEAIRVELLLEQQKACGWTGPVGKYLYDYSISRDCYRGKTPPAAAPVTATADHASVIAVGDKGRRAEEVNKFFLSCQEINQVESELRERKRQEAREREEQERLMAEQQRKKKKGKGGPVMRGLSRVGGHGEPPIAVDDKIQEKGLLLDTTAGNGGKGMEVGEPHSNQLETEGGEGGERSEGKGELPPPATATTAAEIKKILQNLQRNEIFQKLIQCAFTLSTEAIMPPSCPLSGEGEGKDQQENNSSTLLKILSQLHEIYRTLLEIIEQPLQQHPDLWQDDSLLSEEQKLVVEKMIATQRQGEGEKEGERGQQGQQEEDDHDSSPSSSPTRRTGTSPPSPSATSSPFPSSSFPYQLIPTSSPSATSSSYSLSIPSLHPLIPMNSNYHSKYKFLYSLSPAEVISLFKALHLKKYLHLIADKEITGMTLQHCLTVEDLQRDIGITSKIKCREFLTYLKQMKLSGVPLEYLQQK